MALALSAVSILVYTGAEVMVLRSRPLWHTVFLPVNFALTAGWARWAPCSGGALAARRARALPVDVLRQLSLSAVVLMALGAGPGPCWACWAWTRRSMRRAAPVPVDPSFPRCACSANSRSGLPVNFALTAWLGALGAMFRWRAGCPAGSRLPVDMLRQLSLSAVVLMALGAGAWAVLGLLGVDPSFEPRCACSANSRSGASAAGAVATASASSACCEAGRALATPAGSARWR